jgi:hypothetical protein
MRTGYVGKYEEEINRRREVFEGAWGKVLGKTA